MANGTLKSAIEKMHVTFRVEEELHTKATKMASSQGGLSKIIRNGFEDFLAGRVVFEPEKFRIESGSSAPKEKRVSMKLDENMYAEIQSKAVRFGGVSGLVRAVLKVHCSVVS